MMGAVVISQHDLKLYVETNQLIGQCDYSSAFNLSKLAVHSSTWVWGQRSQSWGWLTLCRCYRTYMREGAHVSCQDKKYHKQQLQTALLKIPPTAAAADQSAVFLLTFTVFTHQTQPDTNIQTSAGRFRNTSTSPLFKSGSDEMTSSLKTSDTLQWSNRKRLN